MYSRAHVKKFRVALAHDRPHEILLLRRRGHHRLSHISIIYLLTKRSQDEVVVPFFSCNCEIYGNSTRRVLKIVVHEYITINDNHDVK